MTDTPPEFDENVRNAREGKFAAASDVDLLRKARKFARRYNLEPDKDLWPQDQ